MLTEGRLPQLGEDDLDFLEGNGYESNDQDPQEYQDLDPSEDITGLYFKEAALLPLLTTDQEVELAKRIEAGKEAAVKLGELVEDGVIISNEEIEVLNAEINDGQAAKDFFVRSNLRLVISVAKKYLRRGVDFVDLIQDGNIGLLRAVQKFDYRLGNKFSTYATWWIRQAITRSLSDKGKTIRIPVHMQEQISSFTSFVNRFELQHGRVPTDSEIMASLGMSKEKTTELRRIISLQPLSLDATVNDDEEDSSELGYFIVDPTAIDPSEVTDMSVHSEELKRVINELLTPREVRVLSLRFGLDGNEVPLSLQEIGDRLGVTRERIRQILSNATRKLKHPRLNGFWDALK